MPTPIRIAVIGAGAFGRNHLRVLHELTHASSDAATARPPAPNLAGPSTSPADERVTGLPRSSIPVQLVAAVDLDPAIRAEASARYNIPAFASVDDLLAADLGLHAATVAAPTRSHARIAVHLLEAGLDVLVEKPLTATLEEADFLIALAVERQRILAVGHLERFNPAVTAALARLTRPMFFEAHRLSVFTPRSLDVDVVLDLMIHDLDILLTMANAPVAEIRAVGLPILSGKVDIANVRLQFSSGAVANLTASRVSTEQVRKLRLFQPAQYLSLDYARQELLAIDVDPAVAMSRPDLASPPLPVPSQSAQQPHPSAGLRFEKLGPPRAEPLRLELENFLHAVSTRTSPRVTAPAARAALALALEINAEIRQHAHQTGLLTPSPQA